MKTESPSSEKSINQNDFDQHKLISAISLVGSTIELNRSNSIILNLRDHTYFIYEGIQCFNRFYNGSVSTIDISTSPYLTSCLPTSLIEENALIHLDCITDSKIIKLTVNDFQQLLGENKDLERLTQTVIESKLHELFQHHIEITRLSIEDRFKCFFKRNKTLLQRVPHKYLASYLNMHATNFSKLMGKVRI